MVTTDEKLDRIVLVVEHIANELDDFRSEMTDFRKDLERETAMLRNQVASVAQALNTTIAENDLQHCELKAKDEALERVQKQHSADIMELRAAI